MEKLSLAPSELILNPDGSVYHLHLLPHDLAPIVINVGDPDRVALVSSYFDEIEIKKQKREFVTHTGIYKGKRMTVLSTGIGTDNIDIVYNELDALVNINLETRKINDHHTSLNLIRIGTSGALHADIPVDAFVCSTFGLGLDGLLNYYQLSHDRDEQKILEAFFTRYPLNIGLPRPYLKKGSQKLIDVLSEGMQRGITASCAGFYAPQSRRLRLDPSYPDLISDLNQFRYEEHRITNFEMETGAMYGLAALLGHHCCSVNLIVANRINGEFSTQAEESMHRLIQTTLNRLVHL